MLVNPRAGMLDEHASTEQACRLLTARAYPLRQGGRVVRDPNFPYVFGTGTEVSCAAAHGAAKHQHAAPSATPTPSQQDTGSP